MKEFLSLLAFIFTSIVCAEPRAVVSPVDHLFVPKGFDNNDNVEVVVTGKFPNPCYIKNKVAVKVKNDKIFVNVSALKKDEGNDPRCEAIPVPFKEEITIGNLQGGQ